MTNVPQSQLGAELRSLVEHAAAEDAESLHLMSVVKASCTLEESAELIARAARLDSVAYGMAAEWFASQGRAVLSVERLEAACPGFTKDDYREALDRNLLWARK